MKKVLKVISVTLAFAFMTSQFAFAGKIDYDQKYRSPKRFTVVLKEISLRDINRIITTVIPELQKEGRFVKKSPASIINAKKLDNTHFVVRILFGEYGVKGSYSEDFLISTKSFTEDSTDPTDVKYYIGADPVYSIDEMVKIYGPSCFYFGIFDDNTHEIAGFGIAERINRWASWDDMSYYNKDHCFAKSGINERFADLTRTLGDNGKYPEKSSNDFVKAHPNM